MEKILLIFLSKVNDLYCSCIDYLPEIEISINNSIGNISIDVSAMEQQQLLLKNRGNASKSEQSKLILESRIKSGLSIAQLCRNIGLTEDNYSKYETGVIKEQFASLESLNKIATGLELDYTSLLTPYQLFKLNSQQNITQFMLSNNLTNQAMADLCSVSTTTVKQWKRGVCSPSLESWKILKEYTSDKK